MKQITVLMSTYNGEKYLKEQIESILNQKKVKLRLVVRDDGSSDGTVNILKEYQKTGKLIFYEGKNVGPAKSFFDLLNSKYVKSNNLDMYYSFSDQDDIWKSDKLYRAVTKLSSLKQVPALYCADFQRIDENNNKLKNNFHYTTSTFNYSIVCSYCTGCTMVFNSLLFDDLLNKIPTNMVMHDDWIHKVCLAIGGKVYFDSKYRAVFYRQHSGNVVGSQAGFFSKLKHLYQRLFDKKDCMLNEFREILRLYYSYISSDNIKTINELINYKNKSLGERVKFANSKKFRIRPIKLRKEFFCGVIFKTY
ncbi:glycosyltransferase family 2 protein [Lactobacillus kefiranofaciens subsp. kefirgranum]|uniref:glycosyltransferase family 2 protein n=1 Tax=Lactobacillus kefiranofaciens TaxID=267818 RepID=UPI00202DE0C0|nr:glycosyltransferase family 2 protein [Lactobacillus kefiranofaciens]URW70820.1 glycosyltransferase family 2 protein [Lactobacillus kefiranofaciens subsp. kefirgranum]URW72764.1 glycosyltransferase family 2 protein [Lactobacillus kefiranofaciens subsp. kefirgranum]